MGDIATIALYSAIGTALDAKQDKSVPTLATTAKTIEGAIDELNTNIGAIQLYQHIYTIRYADYANNYGYVSVFSANPVAYTYSQLAQFLYNNNLRDKNHYLPASGNDDWITKYAAASSGGSPTSSFPVVSLILGMFSEDGTTIKYRFISSSTRALNATEGSGTWLEHIVSIRII